MAPGRSSASLRDFVLPLYKVVELFKILRNYTLSDEPGVGFYD